MIAACALAAHANGQEHANDVASEQRAAQYDREIAALTDAIRRDDKNASYYWQRALVRWRKAYECGQRAEYKAGVADCDRAIELDPRSAQAFYVRGKCRHTDFVAAINDFTKATQVDPNYAEAYSARGAALLENARLASIFFGKKVAELQRDRAIEDFSAVIRLAPDNAAAYYDRGVVWDLKLEYEKAIADYTDAIRLDAGKQLYYRRRGSVLERKAMRDDAPAQVFDQAIADFTTAIRLAPDDAELYRLRGEVWSSKGLWADSPADESQHAIADFTETLRLNPNDAIALEARAKERQADKQLDDALADCNALIAARPRIARLYVLRGGVWREKSEPDKAISDYSQAIRLDPKLAEAYLRRGQTLAGKTSTYEAIMARARGVSTPETKKLEDEAIADYTEAIRLEPGNAEAYYYRGNVWSDKEQFDKAIEDFTAVVGIKPDYFRVHSCRGNAYKAKGDYDAAIADFEEAMRLDANSPALVRYFKMSRAECWLAKKDYDRAIAYFTEIGAFNKRRAAWRAMGKFQQVRDELEEEIRKKPDDARLHEELARLLATCPDASFRDGRKAIEHATKASELHPGYGLTTLAAAYAEAGDFEEAVKWQRKAIEQTRFEKFKARYRKVLERYERGEPYRERHDEPNGAR
ncbi:MAG TPA: tetratricopeptide repeat protein [Pirellulales bacterium]|nr:tetratricopeptide repeat protein [Pirellulales bacterium]